MLLSFLAIYFTAKSILGEEKPKPKLTNSIGMTFALIPSGEFMMGGDNPPEQVSKRFGSPISIFTEEHPQHPVEISRPFYLGITEVTQKQWQKVMHTSPWTDKDLVNEGDSYPAMYVSWDDAQEFCQKLTRLDGRKYTLPTEAEWEYACRAGTQTTFSFGNSLESLGKYAWTAEIFKNGRNQRFAQRVAQKPPNKFGLYDMHGNVTELCHDYFGAYSPDSVIDPRGPKRGASRVCRGGSWYFNGWQSRSATRGKPSQNTRNYIIGFRIKTMADSP